MISRTSSAPPCGINGTSAAPPSSGLWSPIIGNIRQSTSPNFRNSYELNAAVDRKFSNYPIVLAVSTQVFGGELSDSSSRDINTQFMVNLATESVNSVAPQFVNCGLSDIDALNKVAGVWIPSTRIRRYTDVTPWIAADNTVGKVEAV